MTVTEFIESMRRKRRQNSLTTIIPQTNNVVKNESRVTNENQYINITFLTEEKLVTTVKRRYESQVPNIITYIRYLINNIFLFLLKNYSCHLICIDFKCCFKNSTKVISKNTC